MPPWRGSLKRGFYSGSTCSRRFSNPPHTAKRDTSTTSNRPAGSPPAPAHAGRHRRTPRRGAPDLSSTVSDLGERRCWHEFVSVCGSPGRRPPAWSSASATMRPSCTPTRNAQTVLTTDALVEGVHFDRRFSRADDIGTGAGGQPERPRRHGRTPRWALLSLVLPDALPVADVDGMVDGIAGAGGAAHRGRGRRQPRAQPGTRGRRHHRRR